MSINSNENFYLNFIIAGFSAGISKTVFAPIERVRILIQTNASNIQLSKDFKNARECARFIYKTQGFLSFWNGNLSNVLRYLPNQSINIGLKDIFRSRLNVDNIKNKYEKFLVNCFCGSFGSLISMLLTYPLDVSRTVMASNVNNKLGLIHTLKHIYNESGVSKGLYKGFTISLCNVLIYRFFYFGSFDTFKDHEIFKNNVFYKFLMINSIIISIGFFVYPIDTIRRNLMIESDHLSKYKLNIFGYFKLIKNKYGVFGLYRGMMINVFRSFSSGAVLILYDEIKNKYNNNNL